MDRRYTNQSNIPLSLAVFLAKDNYDHEENTVSATKFTKSVRQLVLADRVPEELQITDISSMLASRTGSAIHDGIEHAWLSNPEATLKLLGYPDRMISRIKINPDPDTVTEDDLPVYLEQRAYREIEGITISGKFDMVIEDRVEDFKNTGTFAYTSTNKDRDYKIQGSIYRWLNPKIIKDDHLAIQFLFKDWAGFRAKADPNYPQSPIATKLIPLMSIPETEAFLRQKINDVARYKDSPEKDIPLCSDSDLWRTEPAFKYYSRAENKRATKNFGSDKQAAYQYLAEKNGKGVIKEVPGEVKACGYCPAYTECTQKDIYLADGSLKL